MTKKDLITSVAEQTELKKKDVKAVVECVFDTIGNTLVDGEEVNLTGFGKFVTVDVPERECRNPQTGAVMTVPAHKKAAFRVSTSLKNAVR